MNDPNNRSTDKYYRAAPKPLFRETKEGRVKRQPSFSYKQTVSDVAASADKYYATPVVQIDESRIQNIKTNLKTVDIANPAATLTSIISAFSSGFNAVTLSVYDKDLTNVRTAIDMAVGRNTLTREQADSVSITIKPEPVVENKTEIEMENSSAAAQKPFSEANTVLLNKVTVEDVVARGSGSQKKGRKRKASEAVVEDNVGETAGLAASLDTTPAVEQELTAEELRLESPTDVNADDSDE